MSKYEDFFKDIYVRRFPSGVENEASRGTLKKAFINDQNSDQSPERMERLKKMLKKSQIGRETLDFLDQKGSKLIFEKMPYYGYFDPEHNVVALSPSFSDEDLAITFVHEVRHARQDSIMTNTSSNMTPETLLKNGFMIEADACATECILAHQMIEKGDYSIFEAHQKTAYAPMSTAFEKEFAKSHDWNKARDAAFMEWYNLPVKPGYANSYIDFMKEISKNDDPADFRKEMDTKKMAQKLCLDSNGECYVQNPKKLESPEKLNISERQSSKMISAVQPFMKRQKRSAEQMGLNKIHVSHYDGSYTTVMTEMKKQKTKDNSAIRAASKSRGGR